MSPKAPLQLFAADIDAIEMTSKAHGRQANRPNGTNHPSTTRLTHTRPRTEAEGCTRQSTSNPKCNVQLIIAFMTHWNTKLWPADECFKYNDCVDKRIVKWAKRFQVQIKTNILDSFDPIPIIEFITTFKLASDTNGAHTGASFWLLPSLVKKMASTTLKYLIALSSKAQKFRKERIPYSCSKVINFLLETYTTGDVIEENGRRDPTIHTDVKYDANRIRRGSLGQDSPLPPRLRLIRLKGEILKDYTEQSDISCIRAWARGSMILFIVWLVKQRVDKFAALVAIDGEPI